jgi:hypothetical protein
VTWTFSYLFSSDRNEGQARPCQSSSANTFTSQPGLGGAKRPLEEDCVGPAQTKRTGFSNLKRRHVERMVLDLKLGFIEEGEETIKMLLEQTRAQNMIVQVGGQCSGNRIHGYLFQETYEHDDQKPLHISGPPDTIEEAKGNVIHILNQNDERDGFGRRRRGEGGPVGDRVGSAVHCQGGEGMAGMPSVGGEGGEKTEHIRASVSKVGMVINKGGETIQSMNQASGAYTEINENALPDARVKNCLICWPPECMGGAKHFVIEKIGRIMVGLGKCSEFGLNRLIFRAPIMEPLLVRLSTLLIDLEEDQDILEEKVEEALKNITNLVNQFIIHTRKL